MNTKYLVLMFNLIQVYKMILRFSHLSYVAHPDGDCRQCGGQGHQEQDCVKWSRKPLTVPPHQLGQDYLSNDHESSRCKAKSWHRIYTEIEEL